MATIYVDHVGGNDANDGSTFALRRKTMPTAGAVSGGDSVRVMKSPDPTSIGACQWTDNSVTLTPSTPANLLIDDCESGWSGVTNSTVTHGTTSSIRKTGAAYLNDVVATGFTTGKLAYKNLGATLDLSAYQQISLWFMSTSTITTTLFLDLCSDTAGDTPIISLDISIPGGTTASVWRSIVVDYGAALPSGVNSIALRATTDPGSVTYRMDNIVACKAPSDAACITHQTLIGKDTVGEPEWYPINEITSTTLGIGAAARSVNSNPARPYRGTTESVTTYVRQCVPAGNLGQMDISYAVAATYNNRFEVSGGWNSTDMSSQDGETWITGKHYLSGYRGTMVYCDINNIGFAHCELAVYNMQGLGSEVNLLGCIGCTNVVSFSSSFGPSTCRFNIAQIWGCTTGLLDTMVDSVPTNPRFKIGRLHGFCNTAVTDGALSPARIDSYSMDFEIEKLDNNTTAIYMDQTAMLRIRGCSLMANNDTPIRYAVTGGIGYILELENCPELDFSTFTHQIRIKQTNIGGDPELHCNSQAKNYMRRQNALAYSGSYAWELGIAHNTFAPDYPLRFPLAQIACVANKLVTVKCWVRKTHATLFHIGIGIDGNDACGITETRVYMSNVLDTWEEVTLTFTPTVKGVYRIDAIASNPSGLTTRKGYLDSLTVTQAD